jgi:RNA polymerase sigma-70 factor (ECF subfamily)
VERGIVSESGDYVNSQRPLSTFGQHRPTRSNEGHFKRLPEPVEEQSDQQLVSAILGAGSEPAFRLLFERHSARIYRTALRLTGNAMEAEDVLQETWLRTMTRLRTFQWRSSLATWLTGVAANVSRETLERRNAWRIDESADPESTAVAPVHSLDRIDLQRALAELPPGARAAFVLHDVEGLTHEEIAAQLGWTTGTSKTQLHRARRRLQQLLSGQPEKV